MASSNLIHIPPTSASTNAGDASDLRSSILHSLDAPSGKKTLPTTILYDERGLELYDDITTLAGEHYYLFPAEEHILKTHSADVINVMCAPNHDADEPSSPDHTNGVLLELGSGSLRKTAHLISALSNAADSQRNDESAQQPKYIYYALDLAPISITQSLESLAPKVSDSVSLKGLVTDYDSGLKWVREGGLEESSFPLSSPDTNHDDEADVTPVDNFARGRAPRLSSASSTAAVGSPIRNDNPTQTGFLEERSIPDQNHPDTASRSRSRLPRHHNSIRSNNSRSRSASFSSRPDSSITGCGNSASVCTRVGDHESSSNNNESHSGSFSYQKQKHSQQLGFKAQWEHSSPPLHLMFLGSSLGNFDRVGSANFLRSLPLRPGSSDTLLLGLDGRNEKSRVERAYNDPEGYTEKFIMNGLNVASKAIGLGADKQGGVDLIDQFDYLGVYNESIGRHEAYYKAKDAFTINPGGSQPISFEKGELVNIEYSYKYSDADAYAMFAESNLRPITRWQDPESLYSLWLLERPAFAFPRLIHPSVPADAMHDFMESVSISPVSSISELSRGRSSPDFDEEESSDIVSTTSAGSPVGPFSTPSLAEYRELWKLWDEITLGMIAPGMLHEKPIHLRHICLFYLGHIPAFLDIHLSRLLNEPHSEPENFKDIFERGIDPHVDDPTKVHPHSIVPEKPEDWPSLESVLAFRDRVRARLERLYEAIDRGDEHIVQLGRRIDRVLWMCFEHEGWHAETLLYMLIQRAGTQGGTLPPHGFASPVWTSLYPSFSDPSLASTSPGRPHLKDLVALPAQTLTIGHDDFESNDHTSSSFESHYEFGWDNEHPQRQVSISTPVLVEKHCVTNGEYLQFFRSTRKVNDDFPASWVLSCDKDEEYKVRTLYGPVPFIVAKHWPLVASYDEIDSYAKWKGGRLLNEYELRAFIDQFLGAESTPIGFKEWSFIEALEPEPEQGTRGHNGGVWEWSSSVLDAHKGFVASSIYPGYSSDFFDESHHVVLGGSFATIPRIAQRRTVRNYYQHNYKFAWVGGRVAYDA